MFWITTYILKWRTLNHLTFHLYMKKELKQNSWSHKTIRATRNLNEFQWYHTCFMIKNNSHILVSDLKENDNYIMIDPIPYILTFIWQTFLLYIHILQSTQFEHQIIRVTFKKLRSSQKLVEKTTGLKALFTLCYVSQQIAQSAIIKTPMPWNSELVQLLAAVKVYKQQC